MRDRSLSTFSTSHNTEGVGTGFQGPRVMTASSLRPSPRSHLSWPVNHPLVRVTRRVTNELSWQAATKKGERAGLEKRGAWKGLDLGS